MILVCNTGPVIALAKIGHLDILRHFGESVQIPETVFHELLGKPGEETDRILAATRDFLRVVPPVAAGPPPVVFATRHLDAGERAVVCLAATYQPHAGVLLDDAAGRETACRLGIPVTGFVGVLPAAKQRKLISRVLPLLDQARSSGYWLSDDLVETARQISGE